MSILGFDEEQRKRMREIAKEAELRREQLEELERAIRMRIENEIEDLRANVSTKYRVIDLEEDITEIRRQLTNDASGKAQSAADERIRRHYRMTMSTNIHWGHFINSFGFASLWKRLTK